MSKQLISDALWAVVQPLLPPKGPKPNGGRPRVRDRAALTGIVFVLKSGLPWEMLPQELGCGSGMTCWHRLRDWRRAGVWELLRQELLRRLQEADKLDWSRASLDAASVAVKRGADQSTAIVHRPWGQNGGQNGGRMGRLGVTWGASVVQVTDSNLLTCQAVGLAMPLRCRSDAEGRMVDEWVSQTAENTHRMWQ